MSPVHHITARCAFLLGAAWAVQPPGHVRDMILAIVMGDTDGPVFGPKTTEHSAWAGGYSYGPFPEAHPRDTSE